jgi:hypothetical protein
MSATVPQGTFILSIVHKLTLSRTDFSAWAGESVVRDPQFLISSRRVLRAVA